MAVKVHHDGYVYECDSPKEAAELTHALKGERQPGNQKQSAKRTPKAESTANHEGLDRNDFQKMWANLPDRAKKILVSLRDADDELDTHELAKRSGIADPQEIKYSTKTIAASARRSGIDDQKVVFSRRIAVDGKTKSLYKMSDEVRKALEKFN